MSAINAMHDILTPDPLCRPVAGAAAHIHVCPLSSVPQVVSLHAASHLVTCLKDHHVVETPAGIGPANHMRLHIDDIAEPMDGLVAPDAGHVAQLLQFALAWDRQGHMVIHCWAGISRSTAAAFITLCALNPEADEALVARMLRAASPTAYPNRLMVRLGDAALGRRGRMLQAVEAIGRGEVATEAVPFSLPVNLAR
jgi:predicted protein tyrosine phosphatase